MIETMNMPITREQIRTELEKQRLKAMAHNNGPRRKAARLSEVEEFLGMKLISTSTLPGPISGVYVLLSKGEVIYIGKSTDIVHRLHNHPVAHDAEFFMPCEPRDLDNVERALISRFKPGCNRAWADR